MIFEEGVIEVCCNGDIGTRFYRINKESKMIFQIEVDEDGSTFFSSYENEQEWLDHERAEIKGTILEEDSEKYIAQYVRAKDIGDVDLTSSFVGRILIKGEVIIPKIKSAINVLDL